MSSKLKGIPGDASLIRVWNPGNKVEYAVEIAGTKSSYQIRLANTSKSSLRALKQVIDDYNEYRRILTDVPKDHLRSLQIELLKGKLDESL